MKIKLNGNDTETAAATLADLVSEFVAEKGVDTTALIAEYNFRVIKQEVWPEIRLSDGDVVELLSFVGGG